MPKNVISFLRLFSGSWWCLCDVPISTNFCYTRLNFSLNRIWLLVSFPSGFTFGKSLCHFVLSQFNLKFSYCFTDLFLFCDWSLILLPIKLLSRSPSSQKVFTRKVCKLGSKGGKTKGQSIRLHNFSQNHTISS